MKRIFLAFALLLSSQVQANIIDFNGAYDVSNWTQSPAGGSIDTSLAPASVTFTSSDDGTPGTSITEMFITVASGAAGLVSFDWLFNTTDVDGSEYDPFGWMLNGIFTQVTTNGLFSTQSGSVSFSVAEGDTFGFRALSVDSILGASTAVVSNFQVETVGGPNANAVPEPGMMFLFGAGLLAMGLGRRRSSL